MLTRKKFFVELVVIAFLAISTLAACANAAPTAPPPRQLVEQAAHKLLATQSLHFIIDFSGTPTYLDRFHTVTLRRVEGDVVRPDRMRASVKAAVPGAFIQINAIGVGNDQYATNPLTGQWQKIPLEWGFNPITLFEGGASFGAILSDVRDLTALADESIENQRHYHLRGAVPGSRIAPLTGWLVGETQIQFELWIGADDQYVRRARLIDVANVERTSGGTPLPPATWNMELSKFNVAVNIIAPLAQ